MKRTRPINILLIENNPGDVRLTQEAFKETQIEVNLKVAIDGAEALQLLRNQPPLEDNSIPDLILLDLNLPYRDRRAVWKAIKSDQKLKIIPVVVLSTTTTKQDIFHSYQLHNNCYLNKPNDLESFCKMVKKVEAFWLQTAVLPSISA